MFSSYFFIPANQKRFIEKGIQSNASFLIFDLEESVCLNDLSECLINLQSVKLKDNYWIRIPLHFPLGEKFDDLITRLHAMGFCRYMLPKLKSEEEFEQIIKYNASYNDLHYGILVETPELLIRIDQLLLKYRKQIDCVLIGSHDYCNHIGCKHTFGNLVYLRQRVLTVCKAMNIPVIDFVTQELTDSPLFIRDCRDAFDMGFDGKALIHPNQLNLFNELDYYSQEEVQEAIKVYEKLQHIDIQKFSVIRVQDRIYEHPHLKRILDIITWYKNKMNKDDL